MRVAVVGTGIVGVATAYELASDGHEVTVFERRPGLAEEASFAHAGLLGPGFVAPWPLAVQTGWQLGWRDWRWVARHRRAMRHAAASPDHRALHRLALASRSRRQQLITHLGLAADHPEGLMLLFRHKADWKATQATLEFLRDAGTAVQDLTPDAARHLELALNTDTTFHGAAYLPHDEAGNCRQFAQWLRTAAQELGATFRLGSAVPHLDRSDPTLLFAGGAAQRFDAVVACTGAASRELLAGAGVKLPIGTLVGHALSAQIREPLNAPHRSVYDVHHGVAISCIGHRVRVSGGAEIGFSAGRKAAALQRLYNVLHHWFPGAAKVSADVQEWSAGQAFLPDGLPAIGPSRRPGLWLNLGFGKIGGALACGAARNLADQIAGRAPEIDPAAFSPSRPL